MSASAWEEVTPKILRNSWKNQWTDMQVENQDNAYENEEAIDNSKFVEILDIERCAQLQEEDVSEWMNSEKDDPGYQLLSDDEIVAQCSQHPGEHKSFHDDVEEKMGVNHTEVTSMFEELLSYLSLIHI